MTEFETVQEFEQDGWHIEVSFAPDYDYRPGEDDDIYPVLEYVGYYGVEEEPRDYNGQFLPRPIVVTTRQGMAQVTPTQIARLIEISGGNPRTMRRWITETANAIGRELLSWVVVRVTATRGEIEGSATIGGVEYDLREREPARWVLYTVEEAGMVEEAIEDAARQAVGNLAPLALSY